MLDDLQIRPAIATDLPRLMAFDHSVYSEYVWQMDLQKDSEEAAAFFRQVRLPREVHVTYPRQTASLADQWNRQPGLVAVLPTGPAGYVRMMEQSAAGHVTITDLAVHPGLRRKGIATSLVRAVESWSLEQAARRIIIEMSSKNHPAIRLAQSLGYEFCGYNDQYYASQDITLFFGRALK